MSKNIQAKISDVKTIHTNEGARADQPLVEFTLEMTIDKEKKELKFTEMLCNLANLDSESLSNLLESHIKNYVETAFGWAESIEPKTGDWSRAKDLIGKTYTINI
jgi:hypothetical protein